MVGSEVHRNFPEQMDTVMDQIVSIEKVDIKNYPKVYDLTVPSTLNFGLANGLHVVDTADTGHMHHRMVKALEDIKVFNDGSVRNAFGVIFQFAYGGDGFDAGMLEGVKTKTGQFSSFVSTRRLAGKLNTKYGYVTPGEPEPDVIIPKPHSKYKLNQTLPNIPTPKYVVGGNINGDKIMMVKADKLLVQSPGSSPRWVMVDKL